ncbi:J domain-containing protein 1, partial [Elasticomyces elasticus]
MIHKKSSILLSSCSTLQSLGSTASPSTSSPRPNLNTRQQRCRNKQSYQGHIQKRSYATLSDDIPPTANADLTWPAPPHGHVYPTPYQIFALEKSAPYSKARFYELVKLYHPDRNHCSSTPAPAPTHPERLSHKVKIERYRLIVAAHTILSDPARRSAYDRFGAGWNGRPDAATPGSG